MFSLGVVTARDEWVYDLNKGHLEEKVRHLIMVYNKDVEKQKGKTAAEIREDIDYSIKWTRAVKADLLKGKKYYFASEKIVDSLYRPFSKRKLYFSKELNEMQYLMRNVFGPNGFSDNVTIYLSGVPSSKPFSVFATDIIAGLDFLEKTQCLPYTRYSEKMVRTENITDWALEHFRTRYFTDLSKEDIFHYVYAVLHNPAYRKKYELNLKREFPRIPFYDNFRKWAGMGKRLIGEHLTYEIAEPWPIERVDTEVISGQTPQISILPVVEEPEALYGRKPRIKVKLKAIKAEGKIEIDDVTTLFGIPSLAWEYKLGNRSALEWVLDQYKEKKPSDPTIAEKFNTYRFADYKEDVIDLLARVCTVSVETMKIVSEMEDDL